MGLSHPRELELFWLLQTILMLLALLISIPCIYASIWHRMNKIKVNRAQAKIDAIVERHEVQRLAGCTAKRLLKKEEAPVSSNQLALVETRRRQHQPEQQQPNFMFVMPSPPRSIRPYGLGVLPGTPTGLELGGTKTWSWNVVVGLLPMSLLMRLSPLQGLWRKLSSCRNQRMGEPFNVLRILTASQPLRMKVKVNEMPNLGLENYGEWK